MPTPKPAWHADQVRSPFLLIISVRSRSFNPNPPFGYKVKRPFANFSSWRFIWWRYLNVIRLVDAMNEVRLIKRDLDYRRRGFILSQIIDYKLTLFNMDRNKAVVHRYLKDTTWGNIKIDKNLLRVWGMMDKSPMNPSSAWAGGRRVYTMESIYDVISKSKIREAIDRAVTRLLRDATEQQEKAYIKSYTTQEYLIQELHQHFDSLPTSKRRKFATDAFHHCVNEATRILRADLASKKLSVAP